MNTEKRAEIKRHKDATARFVKLFREREDYSEDAGYTSITEELAGVAVEIGTIQSRMLRNKY